MKKKVLIIVGIIVAILVVAGLVTSYADSARVRNGVEPKFTIKIVTDGGNKVTYWGLGYKVVRYPSVSPNEPYKNNRGVKYGNWFMKYEINDSNVKESTYEITDVENVSINIYDIFNTGATIIIKDTNVTPSLYGEWYKIEKEIDGKWYECNPIIKDYGFVSIGHAVDKNNEVKFEIDWEWLYGKLASGNYRILKESHHKYIAVTFSISTNP